MDTGRRRHSTRGDALFGSRSGRPALLIVPSLPACRVGHGEDRGGRGEDADEAGRGHARSRLPADSAACRYTPGVDDSVQLRPHRYQI